MSLHVKYEYDYVAAMKLKFEEKYQKMVQRLERINNTILPVDFNQTPIDYYAGVGYFNLKEFGMALDHFNAALKLRPSFPTIKHNLASTYYSLKMESEAEKLYQELKNEFPNYIEPQVNLLALYSNAGKNDDAIALIRSIEAKFVTYHYVDGKEKNDWSHYISFEKRIKNHYIYNQIKGYYASQFVDKLLSDGVFRYPDDGTVYLLKDGKKCKFRNEVAFFNEGYRWDQVIILPLSVQFENGKQISGK